MGILNECHGMSTEEAMMEGPKRIWWSGKGAVYTVPVNKPEYTRADLVRELEKAAERVVFAIDSAQLSWILDEGKKLKSALAAWKAMEG